MALGAVSLLRDPPDATNPDDQANQAADVQDTLIRLARSWRKDPELASVLDAVTRAVELCSDGSDGSMTPPSRSDVDALLLMVYSRAPALLKACNVLHSHLALLGDSELSAHRGWREFSDTLWRLAEVERCKVLGSYARHAKSCINVRRVCAVHPRSALWRMQTMVATSVAWCHLFCTWATQTSCTRSLLRYNRSKLLVVHSPLCNQESIDPTITSYDLCDLCDCAQSSCRSPVEPIYVDDEGTQQCFTRTYYSAVDDWDPNITANDHPRTAGETCANQGILVQVDRHLLLRLLRVDRTGSDTINPTIASAGSDVDAASCTIPLFPAVCVQKNRPGVTLDYEETKDRPSSFSLLRGCQRLRSLPSELHLGRHRHCCNKNSTSLAPSYTWTASPATVLCNATVTFVDNFAPLITGDCSDQNVTGPNAIPSYTASLPNVCALTIQLGTTNPHCAPVKTIRCLGERQRYVMP